MNGIASGALRARSTVRFNASMSHRKCRDNRLVLTEPTQIAGGAKHERGSKEPKNI
jgi:hypothetical protein